MPFSKNEEIVNNMVEVEDTIDFSQGNSISLVTDLGRDHNPKILFCSKTA